MELELGLKFTRISDEFTSDFQIAKDRAGTLFLSRETDTMFVLTAHLKGYKRGNIKIDINEDGSLIGISGEKQVMETVMVGWKLYKKDAEIRGFKKVFRISDGVILDKIKAVFNEDESTLTITMPKKVKGIRGTEIEEVKEERGLVKEGSGNLHIADEQSSEKGKKLKEKIEDRVDDAKDGEETRKEDEDNRRKVDENEEMIEEKEEKEVGKVNDVVKEDKENRRNVDEIEEMIEEKEEKEVGKVNDVVKEDEENRRKVDEIEEMIENKEEKEVGKENDVVKDEERVDEEKEGPFVVETGIESRAEGERAEGEERGGNRCNMCLPIVAGSTLLLSFVVFVIQIIRSKNRSSTRRA